MGNGAPKPESTAAGAAAKGAAKVVKFLREVKRLCATVEAGQSAARQGGAA